MADAAKLSYERLAWAAEWYLRTDTLQAATGTILSLQLNQPITRSWEGDLSRSSSDAQRFTVLVASVTARWLPRYFGLRHRGAVDLHLDQRPLGPVRHPGHLLFDQGSHRGAGQDPRQRLGVPSRGALHRHRRVGQGVSIALERL